MSAAAACELLLLAIVIVLVVGWAPLYVRWPRWSDHEHFATLAYGWATGRLPYRDFININFPGEVYLYWLLGKTCGWSTEWSIYGFDLLSLAAAAGFLMVWSRRLTGRWVAGLGTLATFLSYYTTLSYNSAAQRDSHTALLLLPCVLAPFVWRGRGGLVTSGICFALAFVIRPHVVVFLPAELAALAFAGQDAIRWDGWRPLFGRGLVWSASALVASIALWAPLVIAGLGGDFLEAMRLNLTGEFRELGGLGRPSFATLVRELLWTKQYRGLAVMIALGCTLSPWVAWRSTWAVVLASQAGGIFYMMLHPARHVYLEQAFMAFWALAAGLFLAELCIAPLERRWGVMLALVLALAFQYSHAQYTGSLSLALSGIPEGAPGRYEVWRRQSPAPCPDMTWQEFEELRQWLRTHTGSETRIANFVWGVNLASNVGRRPALPIEGPWLSYHRASEPRMRKGLQEDADVVLLWVPEEFPRQYGSFPELTQVIDSEYESVIRFGRVDVRRRIRCDSE